jgi:hypothetical protein
LDDPEPGRTVVDVPELVEAVPVLELPVLELLELPVLELPVPTEVGEPLARAPLSRAVRPRAAATASDAPTPTVTTAWRILLTRRTAVVSTKAPLGMGKPLPAFLCERC